MVFAFNSQFERAPFLRAGWTPGLITLLQMLALLTPLIVTATKDPVGFLPGLALCLTVTLLWELLFSALRRGPLTWHGVTTAMIIAIMAPADVPLWQLAVAVSFGLVLGELVFGGRGFGFVSAAVVGLAFLLFSFPGHTLVADNLSTAIASIPGAALLLITGLISWRVMLAMLASLVLMQIFADQPVDALPLASSLAFGLIFLVCDPIGTASTNTGRWLHGILVGVLIAVFDTSPGAEILPAALVFATLLGSIFAPSIDQLVVFLNVRRRKGRFGDV